MFEVTRGQLFPPAPEALNGLLDSLKLSAVFTPWAFCGVLEKQKLPPKHEQSCNRYGCAGQR